MWLALALAAVAAAGWLGWQMRFDPGTRFLPARAGAEWVTEAIAPTARLREAVDRELLFRGSFTLAALPPQATLRVRVHRSGVVLVNLVEVGVDLTEKHPDWKRVRENDVTHLLRPGANEIVVYTTARDGPPAAWVELEGAGLYFASDASWTSTAIGEGPRPVRLARTPMSAWGAPVEQPAAGSDALRASLPWLAVFALAAALALVLARKRGEPRTHVLLGASALAIAALAWHNRALDPILGFDADDHLRYVRFILEQGRLPLATDGWSMYHPPLFYLAAGALFALFGEAVALLRGLNAVAVFVQCAALLGSLRLLFPARPRPVLAGFVLGAFVPMQLYLAQYATNEVWTAAFSSLALYLCLRILVRGEHSLGAHLGLGVALGAALLTKVSALLVAAAVLAALGARLLTRDERSPRVWLAGPGATALALLAVAGWSYARVAWHLGSPLVGNWDAASGFLWWQDPGYHTLGDYLRFGESLTRPVFSAWNGCPDALYSTLWGDGLIGGMASVADAPPWRFELMYAGYWLALLPSAGVAIGVCAALVRLAREPRAEWLLLLLVALGSAFALVSLSLRLPYYAQCKAFYGLSALVPFAAFGGLGLDLVASRLGRAQIVIWIALGTWALCSYATYWSRTG